MLQNMQQILESILVLVVKMKLTSNINIMVRMAC